MQRCMENACVWWRPGSVLFQSSACVADQHLINSISNYTYNKWEGKTTIWGRLWWYTFNTETSASIIASHARGINLSFQHWGNIWDTEIAHTKIILSSVKLCKSLVIKSETWWNIPVLNIVIRRWKRKCWLWFRAVNSFNIHLFKREN